MTTRFNRKTISTSKRYVVFPRGDQFPTVEEALEHIGEGYIREYTTIVKDITIIPERGRSIKAKGTYIQSKEVRDVADATPPEEDPPF